MRTTTILLLDHPVQRIGAQEVLDQGGFGLLDLNCQRASSHVVDVAPLIVAVALLGMTVMLGLVNLRSWISCPPDWASSCATTRSKLYFNPLTL